MAARGLTSGMLTAIAATVVRPVLFYEGEYDGGILNLWTGFGDYSWDSKTWTGGGRMLSISPIDEADDLTARGFSVTLTGVPTALISIALLNFRQNKPGTLWLGAMDAAGALIVDPYQLVRGKFDTDSITDNGDTCTITVNYEHELIDLQKPRERRYTDSDQKIDYPQDGGFRYVQSLQDATLTGWLR